MPTPLLKVAQSAIKAAGAVGAVKTVTLRRTASTYTPSTGATSDVVTNYTWDVVVTEYDSRLIDGSTVKVGDKKVLGAALDIAVVPNTDTDTVLIDSVTHKIVRVSSDPADATYELQARR